MAPVDGSGSCPAWMQIVLNRAVLSSFTQRSYYRSNATLWSVTVPTTHGSWLRGRWLTHSAPGRAFVAGAILKALSWVIGTLFGGAGISSLLDFLGSAAFLASGIGLVALLAGSARPRLLWPVRRKLSLSYVFIGAVPAGLIITFFALCGLLVFFSVSAYLMESRVRTLVGEARVQADATAIELRGRTGDVAAGIVARRQDELARVYPAASFALVATGRACSAAAAPGASPMPAPGGRMLLGAGPWAHLEEPASLPGWIGCDGVSTVTVYSVPGATVRAAETGRLRLVVRAVAWTGGPSGQTAVVVDIPVGRDTARQLREDTGIELAGVAALVPSAGDARPLTGRINPAAEAEATSRVAAPARGWLEQPQSWYAFVDVRDWQTGHIGNVAVSIGMSPAEVFRRLSATTVRIGDFNLGQLLVLLLSLIGGLFLVIEVVAAVMGIGLARSITGSVDELFAGTNRIRQGDFTYKIPIRTRDQLGELAESFNSMTASIEGLLREKAEKERLEQELRIAREIQMSLLPQGLLSQPGLSLSAHCEPAREVGGDYYDVLPLGEGCFGLLIADVSGKGTSAALYMAELKGLMLALSHHHRSPRNLLIEANRILSAHLDSRSFITMVYAVVDVAARTMTYARAGHCPVIHVPVSTGTVGLPARVLTPDGMVLGLKLDDGSAFNALLSEETIILGPGDMVALYTDGISEAMNASLECYGEHRLAEALVARRHLPFENLRDGILAEIQAFVGDSPQHDDMTLLLLRMDDVEGAN